MVPDLSYRARAFEEKDIPEALALWRGTEGVGLNESDTPACLRAFLKRNPGLSCVVRGSDDRLIGAVLCGHDGRRGYLHHLAVSPLYRGRGLGRRLVGRCFEALGREGILKCNIFLYSNNEDGRGFWLRLGWGERKDLCLLQHAIAPARQST